MTDVNLDLLIDRGDVQTLSGRLDNVTGTVNLSGFFPQGDWAIAGVGISAQSVGTPAVTIQDNPGLVWTKTQGGVIVHSYEFNYGTKYDATSYWFRFKGSDIRMAPGDYLQYRNQDLEDGSSMDVVMFVNATRLR